MAAHSHLLRTQTQFSLPDRYSVRLSRIELRFNGPPKSLYQLPVHFESTETEINDPFEGFNRGVFVVNEFTDRYFLEYLARGFDFIVPDPLQRGIRNFFENARFPIKFANNLLQLKFKSAAEEVVRLGINSSVGIGGLFDAATQGGHDGE